jgi:hypothetical protein
MSKMDDCQGADDPATPMMSHTGDHTSVFDDVPDEILFRILANTRSIADAFRLAITHRRMWAVFGDQMLWRLWYRARHGPVLHRHFKDYGKDWRWLYRACASTLWRGVGAGRYSAFYYRGDTDGADPNGYGLSIRHLGNYPETYEGEWRDGLPQGYGVATLCEGDSYEGQWHKGRFSGLGRYRFALGSTYEGGFCKGKRHGHGLSVFSRCGTKTRAEWCHGAVVGDVVQTCPDGSRYEGHIRDTKGAHGIGTFVAADGRSYSGRWHFNKRHGHGTMIYADGSRWRGQWRDNQRFMGAPIDHGRSGDIPLRAAHSALYFSAHCACMACEGGHDDNFPNRL